MGRKRTPASGFTTWSLMLCALCFAVVAVLAQPVQSSAGAQSSRYKVPSTNHWRSGLGRDDPAPVSTATVEGRLAVFDDVWETIQARYYDSSFNGIDWQATR